MTTSTIHEGSEAFMRRALHFATREIASEPRIVPLPATWLSYLILSRAGMSVSTIAALLDVHRKYVATRLLTCMAVMAHPDIRARIEALVVEMGRIDFDEREGKVIPFPGPPKLAPRRITEAAI
jgi:hypothetical protein